MQSLKYPRWFLLLCSDAAVLEVLDGPTFTCLTFASTIPQGHDSATFLALLPVAWMETLFLAQDTNNERTRPPFCQTLN